MARSILATLIFLLRDMLMHARNAIVCGDVVRTMIGREEVVGKWGRSSTATEITWHNTHDAGRHTCKT
jgi:hypothetical protein